MKTAKQRSETMSSSADSISPDTSAATASAKPMQSILGTQLLAAGKLTEQDIARIVAHQRHTNARFGEVAVGFGLLSQGDVTDALAEQYHYPYSSLDDSVLSPSLVTARDPFGAKAEVFRTLRSQLMLRGFGEQRHCLMIGSARAGEGASLVAANLAVTFAQVGDRTLLIDANLRSPNVHRLFGLSGAAGISQVLSDRCGLKDVLSNVPPFRNLTVLCAGAPPPNPLELLSQVGFSYLIETLPTMFDVIMIDTPPILEFTDAQIVAARVKACVLATRRHTTRLEDVQRVRRQLAPTGAEVVGAVINC